jgi:L,D-peptidoglycan transpeptidase YkuD (ErfK/YbiS/YcfS/YnhG family)
VSPGYSALAKKPKHPAGRRRRGAAFSLIRVRRRPGQAAKGWLLAGGGAVPVALGRAGIVANKREGDGATPRGVFHPVRVWYRADRGPPPRSLLPIRRITPDDAWSEDPADRNYNRPVKRAAKKPGDRLRRADYLYNIIVEIDHNRRPRVAGRGSAVFFHIARAGFLPTAGCVALDGRGLRRLVARLGRNTRIQIQNF